MWSIFLKEKERKQVKKEMRNYIVFFSPKYVLKNENFNYEKVRGSLKNIFYESTRK